MTTGKNNLVSLQSRIQKLLKAERSPMCWELGYFQAPMLVKEPGRTPAKPHMLVCIDTESMAIMGSDLVQDPPSPQDLLNLLVASMEKPFLGTSPTVLPELVHLDDPAVFDLIHGELGHLDVKVMLVERLSALPGFKKIMERDLFSRQVGSSERAN